MKKKTVLQLAFLAFLIVGTVLILRQHQRRPYLTDRGEIFGTYYSIVYQHDDDLQPQIIKALQEVDREFSMFNDSSTISRINQGETITMTPMFHEVFSLAKTINSRTQGAFDVTVAPLVNAWGFGFKHEQLPDSAQVDSLLQYIGMEKLQPASDTFQPTPHVQLDFSAIAKGYGCDVVARLFKRLSIQNYMIEIGGEVVCHGKNPDGQPWHIGINKPSEEETAELQTVIEVKDKAIATSGNYRRFYYQDGQRRAHTIDPRTGYPVNHSLLSATVLADDCATADAYATAFMVLGLEEAKDIISRDHLNAYLIYTNEDNAYAVWENL